MSTFQSSYFINSGTINQEIRGGKKKKEKKESKKSKTMHFLCQKWKAIFEEIPLQLWDKLSLGVLKYFLGVSLT